MRIKRMRPIGLLAAVALLSGAVAVPAAAEELTEQLEAGAGQGFADVGKTWLRDISGPTEPPELVQDDTACDWPTKSFPDGVDGQGLFLPDDVTMTNQNKNVVFHIVFSIVESAPSRFNRLEACGKIHPVSEANTLMTDEKLKKDEEDPRNPWDGKLKHDQDHGGTVAPIGPACGMSKGKGWGKLSGSQLPPLLGGPDPDVNFRFFWPATVGGTLPIEGKWDDKNSKTGTLVAVFQAQGGLDCLDEKTSDPKDETGARTFTVVGDFEAVAADAKLH